MSGLRLVCFGDSNTYGFDPRSFLGGRFGPEVRWTGRLAAMCPDWTVLERGMNGREIPHTAGQMADLDALLTEAAPVGLLFVMLGTNDLLDGPAGAAAELLSAVVRRMDRLLLHLTERGVPTLLTAPPALGPAAAVPSTDAVEASHRLGDAYRALAERYGVCFADAAGWGLPLLFDGIHLSEAAHARFAEKIRQAVEGARI